VELACGRLRRHGDPAAAEADLADAERRGRDRCHVSWWTDADGHLVGSFRLDPLDADVVRRALAAATEHLTDHEPSAEHAAEPLERRRARALAGIAADWLDHPDTGDGATPEVVVHLDASALTDLTRAERATGPTGHVPAGTPEAASRDLPATDVPAGTSAVSAGGERAWPVRTDLRWHHPSGARVDPGAAPLAGTLADLVSDHEHHGIDVTTQPGGHWAGDHIDWDCFFAAFAPPPPLDRSAWLGGPAVPNG
jgi:hypothetical protein